MSKIRERLVGPYYRVRNTIFIMKMELLTCWQKRKRKLGMRNDRKRLLRLPSNERKRRNFINNIIHATYYILLESLIINLLCRQRTFLYTELRCWVTTILSLRAQHYFLLSYSSCIHTHARATFMLLKMWKEDFLCVFLLFTLLLLPILIAGKEKCELRNFAQRRAHQHHGDVDNVVGSCLSFRYLSFQINSF